MSDTEDSSIRPILEAIAFAARAHQHQKRKDDRTPYVSHVFRVSFILRDVFGITDRQALLAAILHDTVEDTTTDFDDIEKHFGREVADWVACLTKEKRLPEAEREMAYVSALTKAPWQVKVCKLADVYDNLIDSDHLPPEKKQKSLRNARRYLDGLKPGLPAEAASAWQIVNDLYARQESASAARRS